MTPEPQRIFDGHNDVLLRLWWHDRSANSFLDGGREGHLDLPRAIAGGLSGGLFATFVIDPPSAPRQRDPAPAPTPERRPAAGSGTGFLSAYAQDKALAITLGQLAIAFRLERLSEGAVAVCRSVAEIEVVFARGAFSMVLHMEGAEAIGPDLDELEVLHQAGVRSIGPVWSRPTIFGHGVPFRLNASPDIGPGLTDRGIALVRTCNALGIMIDCSHLNERGFWDVARVSDAPLVATHSNAHVFAPVSRNLTDAQMDAIRDSGGVVGLNFGTSFLRPDGRREAETPLSVMTRHLEHMLNKLGPEGVALGSDFDGALIPREIGDAAGLPALVAAMRTAGFDRDTIDAITHKNWLNVLSRTLKG